MYRYWTIPLLCSLLWLAGCDRQSTSPEEAETQATDAADAADTAALDSPVIARVNGTPIYAATLETYRQVRRASATDQAAQQKLLDDLISLTLLKQQARKSGLTDDPALQAALHLERVNTVASAMAREYSEQHPVTDAQAKERYQTMVSRTGGKEYLLRHIALPTKAQVDQILKELAQGAAFKKIADQYAEKYPGLAAAKPDWVTVEHLPAPLAEAVQATPTGNYSKQAVETRRGWYLLKVLDTRPFTPPPFEKLKPGIMAALEREQLDGFVESLRRQAVIEIEAAGGN